MSSDPNSLISQSSTEKGIISEISSFGSMCIKSIRDDNKDLSVYKSWDDQSTFTRLEYKEVPIVFNDHLELKHIGQVNQIRLLNLPQGVYTLSINGTNVLSSKEMMFDIQHNFNRSLDAVVKYGELKSLNLSGPCCCGCSQGYEHVSSGSRCLYLQSFEEVRINYDRNLKPLIPQEIMVEYLYEGSSYKETIYKNKWNVPLHSPTEHLSLLLSPTNNLLDSKVIIVSGRMELCRLYNFSHKVVIKFKREESMFDGMEDVYIREKDVYCNTINMSKLPKIEIYTINCEINKAYTSYYMTYFSPHICDINELYPKYNISSLLKKDEFADGYVSYGYTKVNILEGVEENLRH